MKESLRILVAGLRDPSALRTLDLGQWDVLLRVARSSNLLPRLAVTAADRGLFASFPAEVLPHLVSAEVLARHQRKAIAWEVGHILRALDPLGLPLILLKGAAYAMAGLKAADGRLFGDVDILVPESRLPEVEAALALRGWSTGQLDPYDSRYYRQWMHELPPMTHLKRGTVVDVHHNILPRTADGAPPAERMLSAARPLPGGNLKVLSPSDMVIHSATHLFHEGELKNGFRDLFDLDALLTEFAERDASFWTTLPERAHELQLAWPVRLAFRYLRHFLGTNIPERAMIAIGRHPIRDRAFDLMYLRGLLPDHGMCSEPGSSAARAILYLRGHMLRMPVSLLIPHLGRKAFMRIYKTSSRVA